jgi:hypothetical protein
MLRDVAYKGVEGVIKGQNAQGGWGYGVPNTKDTYSDTSVMGWCAQALKAAKLAGIDDRDASEALGSCYFGAPREALPVPENEEFYWADLIGLDTCLAIMETLYDGFKDSKYRPCPLLRKYVEAGWLGRKTGRGFYEYK